VDVPAQNAAQELDRIHNGTGSGASDTASSLRTAILEHVTAIAPDVYEYERLTRSPAADAAELDERRWRVAKLVSRRAPYAMLVRSYFAQLDAIRALFD
jgi:hydroxymethylpyrimidine/phosphomethylpyrimidine kinase